MLMNKNFLALTASHDKKEYAKKKPQNIMVFEKKTQKKIFPKNRAPGKTEISREPRNSRNFFS